MQRSLRQPAEFQKAFGDQKRSLLFMELPDSLWEGVVLNGWKFKNVKFNKTRWHNVKVVNGEFENCIFEDVDFSGNTFENTRFNNTEIIGGTWKGNSFHGGNIKKWQMSLKENSTPLFVENHFKDLTFAENQPKNQVDDRNGWWRFCTFENCVIKKNNFSDQTFQGCVFDRCHFDGNHFLRTKFIGEGGRIVQCSFKNSQEEFWFTNWEVKIQNTSITEKVIIESRASLENVQIDGLKEAVLNLGTAKNVSISNVVGLGIADAEDVQIHNVHPKSKPKNGLDIAQAKNIQLKDIRVGNFNMAHATHASFEDMDVQSLNAPMLCSDCKFKNVSILAEIVVGDEDVIEMRECSFENVQRRTDLLVTHVHADGDITMESMDMPWELPGAQDPATIKPIP